MMFNGQIALAVLSPCFALKHLASAVKMKMRGLKTGSQAELGVTGRLKRAVVCVVAVLWKLVARQTAKRVLIFAKLNERQKLLDLPR